MKHVKLFEDFVNESVEIKSIEDHGVSNSNKYDLIKNHSDIIDILKDPDTWTDDLVFIGSDKKRYSIDDLIGHVVRVGSTVITVEESFINEAKDDNSYTFDNLADYRKAVAALYKANFYRSGNGNPPKGDEPGSYSEDERWLNIRIGSGEKEAAKILKKTRLKYKAEYKKPMGYVVHNQGGYLD